MMNRCVKHTSRISQTKSSDHGIERPTAKPGFKLRVDSRFFTIPSVHQRHYKGILEFPELGIGSACERSRDTAEVLQALRAMSPLESIRVTALIEAMLTNNGVREAAIAFLEAKGISNPALVADRILNDAEGVA